MAGVFRKEVNEVDDDKAGEGHHDRIRGGANQAALLVLVVAPLAARTHKSLGCFSRGIMVKHI